MLDLRNIGKILIEFSLSQISRTRKIEDKIDQSKKNTVACKRFRNNGVKVIYSKQNSGVAKVRRSERKSGNFAKDLTIFLGSKRVNE